MDVAPPCSVALSALENPAAPTQVADDWRVACATESSRSGVVLLITEADGGLYSEYVFERSSEGWQYRGGSAGRSRVVNHRPAPDDRSPVVWRGLTTVHLREADRVVRITGGRASSDVARIAVRLGTLSVDVQIATDGWFQVALEGAVVLEGAKQMILTAIAEDGEAIVDDQGERAEVTWPLRS